MSMIWSSIGIPYPANGKQTNQSYYSHDKASVKSETVQAKLQELRNNLGGKLESTFNFAKKNYWALIVGIVIILLAILLIIYRKKIVSYITNL
jgi:LPXTG-motif cell wall-anchored protein